MTSILAQQLQALGRPGISLPRARGKPSLLFEAQQAADIDLQTIYNIALQGEP
jgi:U3 small nucleolar RNA-associated protein 10